ncbi:MAG: PorV/PorQ family protein [Ignavibacteria bacterium]|nr:PorV/PorQ family protein [Ignavibacteria bacterium]
MKVFYTLVFLLIFSTSYSQLLPNLGGQRTGTASLQFLKIGNGARSAGMGESFVAVSDDISSLYYNPAGLVLFKENGFTASHTQWFVDTRLEYAGGVYHFGGNNAVGLSVTSLRTDDMQVTTELQPGGTGSYFRFSDLAIGLSFARQMTEQFSFGATVKYVEEQLGEVKMKSVLGDLGTYYRTGLGSSRFSVVISNFGGQVSPSGNVKLIGDREQSTFQAFPPPTIFKIGFALEPIQDAKNRLTASVQLNSPNDNAEYLNFGAEYAFKEYLFLRGGYKINVDAENFSAGAGLRLPLTFAMLNLDYALSNYKELGFAQRLSLNVMFARK